MSIRPLELLPGLNMVRLLMVTQGIDLVTRSKYQVMVQDLQLLHHIWMVPLQMKEK